MRFLLKILGFPAPQYDHVAEVAKPVEPELPKSKNMEEICEYLTQKHFLEGLAVFLDGELICSTYDPEEAEREFMVLDYLSEEMGGIYVSHIRTELGWVSLYKDETYTFVVRSVAHPSEAELKGIARDFKRMVR